MLPQKRHDLLDNAIHRTLVVMSLLLLVLLLLQNSLTNLPLPIKSEMINEFISYKCLNGQLEVYYQIVQL